LTPRRCSNKAPLDERRNLGPRVGVPRGQSGHRPDDAFSANRPGWNLAVQPGDIIVGGPNFGTGSARPAPALFRRLGIAAIVAESFSDLFFRNCINYAMPAMPCAGVCKVAADGDEVEVDLAAGSFRRGDVVLRGTPVPPMLMEIIEHGGLMSRLRIQGYIA
jgi:3-isopropylmalate/(R)-2-methylmalate dehydratase small subunit